MTAAALVTATAAALMLGYGPGFALALWVAARRDSKRTPAPRSEACEGAPTPREQAIEAAEDRAEQVAFDSWRERRHG